MDRSFLSDVSVVEASRDFVCVRMATYENATEAEFLATIFRGRTGQLENTVFTILAPDGKTQLTRSGRSPEMALGEERGGPGGPGGRRGPPPDERGEHGPDGGGPADPPMDAMVAKLEEIAARYPATKSAADEPGAMPYSENVRLGLNIAACDMLPLAVVVTKDDAAREKLESELRALAWSDELIGRVVYAATTDRADLGKIEGAAEDAVLLFVQPDAFGREGKLLAQTSKADRASLAKAMADGLAKHDPGKKDAADHIREGRRQGVDWETAVPVTDPHAPPEGERRPPR